MKNDLSKAMLVHVLTRTKNADEKKVETQQIENRVFIRREKIKAINKPRTEFGS